MAKDEDQPVEDDPQLKLSVGDQTDDEESVPASEPESSEQPAETPPAETPPEPPPSLGVRELASEYGLDLSNYEDEKEALKHLAEKAKAADQTSELAQYGQEFVRHAADGTWQKYLEWKEQQAQPQQQEEESLWNPPEWNPAWLQQVRQDENGNLVPDVQRGGNPEVVSKVQKYLTWRQEQQEKFWQNPFEYMKPFVEKQADERARDLVQKELSQYGEQVDARQFIATNKEWLYEQDERGQIQYDNSRPVLSDEGKVFFNALQEINDDPDYEGLSRQGQQKLAMRELQRYRDQKKKESQETPAQRKENELAKAAGYTPSSGASEKKTPASESGAPPQDENATFADMLKAEFAAAGIDPHDDLIQV